MHVCEQKALPGRIEVYGRGPTHPLTLALTLTQTPTLKPDPKRARNGRKTRLRRFWRFIYYSDLRTAT